jgi:hypothetical protein
VTARLWLIMGTLAALASPPAGAGPWSIEPRLGLTADYETNPDLLEIDPKGEEHVAALVDLPLRYDTDELEVMLRPNGRLSNSQGYSSLASNYAHLDTAAQFTAERDSATVQGEVARDSSLYYAGSLVNGIGVRRDSVATSADWTHTLTERSQFQMDASWTRVRYDAPTDFNDVVDYRYWSAGPTWAFSLSERNTLKLLGTYGFYESLSGATQSKSENVQLGFVRQLSEIWTLSTSAGYSRSTNTESSYVDFYGFIFPITEKSNQDGTVYAATLTRQGERFNFSGGVSRALQPTGFAFLSRQDSFNIATTYVRSERWDFGLSAAWLEALSPQVTSGQAELNTREFSDHYLNSQLAANWHWTPQWTISMTFTRVMQRYGPPAVSSASTGISVSFVRRFLRTQF